MLYTRSELNNTQLFLKVLNRGIQSPAKHNTVQNQAMMSNLEQRCRLFWTGHKVSFQSNTKYNNSIWNDSQKVWLWSQTVGLERSIGMCGGVYAFVNTQLTRGHNGIKVNFTLCKYFSSTSVRREKSVFRLCCPQLHWFPRLDWFSISVLWEPMTWKTRPHNQMKAPSDRRLITGSHQHNSSI